MKKANNKNQNENDLNNICMKCLKGRTEHERKWGKLRCLTGGGVFEKMPKALYELMRRTTLGKEGTPPAKQETQKPRSEKGTESESEYPPCPVCGTNGDVNKSGTYYKKQRYVCFGKKHDRPRYFYPDAHENKVSVA